MLNHTMSIVDNIKDYLKSDLHPHEVNDVEVIRNFWKPMLNNLNKKLICDNTNKTIICAALLDTKYVRLQHYQEHWMQLKRTILGTDKYNNK